LLEGYDWFKPDDLPELFNALRKSSKPLVLVGGQSLTFWVSYFGIPVPETRDPYLTQDADVFGTQQDAHIVADTLGGCLRVPGPNDNTPNAATIVYETSDGRKLLIDVMGMLIGLNNSEINETAVSINHDVFGIIHILHPLLVLKSRVCNLHSLPQKRTGNGLAQARLAVQVYKEFVQSYAFREMQSANAQEVYFMQRARLIAKFSQSDPAVFVFREFGIDLLDAVPIDLITHKEFLERDWPKQVEWVSKRRVLPKPQPIRKK